MRRDDSEFYTGPEAWAGWADGENAPFVAVSLPAPPFETSMTSPLQRHRFRAGRSRSRQCLVEIEGPGGLPRCEADESELLALFHWENLTKAAEIAPGLVLRWDIVYLRIEWLERDLGRALGRDLAAGWRLEYR